MDEEADERGRRDIERRIILQSRRIKIGAGYECFDEGTVSDFFAVWRELVGYYKIHNDAMMNIEVLLEYREWTRVFGGMEYDQNLSVDCRERADEAYAELNGYMDDIILYTVRRLYPQGR